MPAVTVSQHSANEGSRARARRRAELDLILSGDMAFDGSLVHLVKRPAAASRELPFIAARRPSILTNSSRM
jgi:hypothetical protein